MNLPKLNLPYFKLDISKSKDNLYIYDVIRKKKVILTPEEWVRQNIITFLIEYKKYPKALIAIEKQINYNGKKKRFDALVYNKYGKPILLVECKSTTVNICEKVIAQIAMYNYNLGCKQLLITNGLTHYFFSAKHHKLVSLSGIPGFNELLD